MNRSFKLDKRYKTVVEDMKKTGQRLPRKDFVIEYACPNLKPKNTPIMLLKEMTHHCQVKT